LLHDHYRHKLDSMRVRLQPDRSSSFIPFDRSCDNIINVQKGEMFRIACAPSASHNSRIIRRLPVYTVPSQVQKPSKRQSLA
jgi:hypothetical protein